MSTLAGTFALNLPWDGPRKGPALTALLRTIRGAGPGPFSCIVRKPKPSGLLSLSRSSEVFKLFSEFLVLFGFFD